MYIVGRIIKRQLKKQKNDQWTRMYQRLFIVWSIITLIHLFMNIHSICLQESIRCSRIFNSICMCLLSKSYLKNDKFNLNFYLSKFDSILKITQWLIFNNNKKKKEKTKQNSRSTKCKIYKVYSLSFQLFIYSCYNIKNINT